MDSEEKRSEQGKGATSFLSKDARNRLVLAIFFLVIAGILVILAVPHSSDKNRGAHKPVEKPIEKRRVIPLEELQATPTPTPKATPFPIHVTTPVPIPTPVATSELAPTATPEPRLTVTPTPVPTATPVPTLLAKAKLVKPVSAQPRKTAQRNVQRKVVWHTVGRHHGKRDTLWWISRHYGVSQYDIRLLNSVIKSPEYLMIGWKLIIPVIDKQHTSVKAKRQTVTTHHSHHQQTRSKMVRGVAVKYVLQEPEQAAFGLANDQQQLKAIRTVRPDLTKSEAREVLRAKREERAEHVEIPCGSIIVGKLSTQGGTYRQGPGVLACEASSEYPFGNPGKVRDAGKVCTASGKCLYQFLRGRGWFAGLLSPPEN